jgi:curli biogenesis system outer membrane secretion channel CsgG
MAATALLPFLFAACATTATVRGGGGGGINAARLEPYNGPKARVAVARFDDKTAKGAGSIGEGMATMLTTALVGSNRFIVLERDVLDEVIREQDLGASGRVKPGTAAPVGQIEGAELLVLGAVTEFEPERLGVGGGIVGLGTLLGSMYLSSKNSGLPVGAAYYTESHVAIDLRAVDAATSRLLFTVSVEAKGQDWGGGVLAEVGGGRSRLPIGFGGFQKRATEEAIRKAIDLGVAELARRTPAAYYRFETDAFAAGRMLAFAYLDIDGLTGERIAQPGLRVATTAAEWASLAAEIGLSGSAAAPPVDFSAQRVAAVFAGAQDTPGRMVSVEKAVGFPDRVELTAALVPPPPGAEKVKPAPSLLYPMALLRLERGAPLTLVWK